MGKADEMRVKAVTNAAEQEFKADSRAVPFHVPDPATEAAADDLYRDALKTIEKAAAAGLFDCSQPASCRHHNCVGVMELAAEKLRLDGFTVNWSEMKFHGGLHCSLEINWR